MSRFRFLRAAAVLLAAVLIAGVWLARSEVKAGTGDWTGHDIDGLHYEVLLPQSYSAARAYPVVLYLHQLDAGTYRTDLRRQVDGWFDTFAFRSTHPCIVIVPMLDQSKDGGGVNVNFGGKRTGQFGEAQTIAALKQVMQAYRTDPHRIYVTGNSLGGMGTWEMLLSYNAWTGDKGRIFAAGMPLAGTHRTANAEDAAQRLRNVPIWAIHGAQDHEVSPDWDRGMARLLAGNPTFHFTEAPNLGHDVWDSFYPRADIWNWLFAQHGP